MQSLDHEVMLPILDRVRRGAITVKLDEYRREQYYENGRQCGRLVARQDGVWAVRLDDKGRELHKRLCELLEDEHDNDQRGWYVGRCGHPVPVMGLACFIGPCLECEPAS